MNGRGPSNINCNTIVNMARFHNQSLNSPISIHRNCAINYDEKIFDTGLEVLCLSRCVWFSHVVLSRCVLMSFARWYILFTAFLFVIKLSDLSVRSWRIVCIHSLYYFSAYIF